jgi:hypothetical protein
MKKILTATLLATTLLTTRADSVVVFNEVMYHPATSETTLEWVELHNQMAVDVDLSGWSIRGGIDYFFAEGTVISGGGYLVVALSPAAITNGTSLTNIVGPFDGRLSNAGKEIELRNNNNRAVDSLSYGVEGAWPVAPDGAGPSLAKFDPDTASDVPASWRSSPQMGGTPGTANWPQTLISSTTRSLVPSSQNWRYEQSGTDLGNAWRATNYNDSAWLIGQGLFAQEDCACLPQPILTPLTVGPTKTTFYFRTSFIFTGNVASAALSLRHVVDDGVAVYLNNNEVYRLGITNPVTFGTLASRGVDNAVTEGPFSIPATGLLPGTNYLAVEVHQNSTASSDVVFGLQLDELVFTTNAPTQNSSSGLPLAFNEMSSVSNAQFWVEVINYGTQPIALDQFVLARFGTTNREYVIPPRSIPAGGFTLLDRAELGFGADPGDRVILYTPGKSNVVDAVVAKDFARARSPDATGKWLRPSPVTPAASNAFAFHDEIVINEILYQARPLPATPAVYFTNVLLSITNEWRYDATGTTNDNLIWAQPEYDDSLWPVGQALFHTNINTLPAAKGTLLPVFNGIGQNIITYYFRTPFVFTNGGTSPQLTLNPLIDDGAIFYVNGVEIYRYNLPTSAVTTITRAITNIGVPVYSGPVTIPVENLVAGTNIFAVELHRYLPSGDIAFGVEVTVSGLASPALPERDSSESWIELFNRSSNAVSLTGWKLSEAVSFDFPSNTVINPGGFLVIVEDPAAMQAKYPSLNVLGPWSGNLSGSSDRIVLEDAAENPADEVRYYDDRPWPGYANGAGSSLELRDARADNSRPEAWAASDQSGFSTWRTNTYRGIATGEPASSPTVWNEFILGLLGEGEVLLDDISVIESPAGTRRQLIQNGNFEGTTNAWRLVGNHRLSQIISEPSNPANHVLRLVATGDTEHRHNQASITLSNNIPVVNGNEYEISYRYKWLAGNNKLNSRLYFHRLARTSLLAVPDEHGTPGAVNSRATNNVGPTFANLRHSPLVPASAQAVTVTMESSDPDGVASATLLYSVNGGAWQSNSMAMTNTVSGVALTGVIPPQAASAIVQFYVRANDGVGAMATYPAGGTNSRALYKVSTGQALAARLNNIRLIMTAADTTALHASTNVMSNEPWGVTVIYNDRDVFYDSTLHLQGSQRGRNDTTRVGFTVRLPAGQLLRGGLDGFTIDRSGGYAGANPGAKQNELLLKHAVNKAGRLPGMYDDLAQVWAPRTAEDGPSLLLLEKYGSQFLDTAYQEGGDGEMYKLELIYYPTTTANGDVQGPKLPQPDLVLGTDIRDLGNDPEAYRWIFLKENRVTRDDYGPMVKLAQTMSLTGTNFDAQIKQVMDVDEWLRAVAYLALIGGTDMYTYGNSHNLIIYFRPEDGKAQAFLWDMDFSFTAATTAAFPGTGSPNTTKLFANPNNNRLYYNHLYDLSAVTGDAAYMSRWASQYATRVGQNWQPAVDYLVQRAAYVRSVMPLTNAFALTVNGGTNFSTTNATVVITGTSPISVRDILVNGLSYPVTWTSLTTWTLTVPLPGYINNLSVIGLDARGVLVTNATDAITITNIGATPLLSVVINEWMADNSGPGGFPDSVDSQFEDWFELYNPNNVAINLSGYYLTDVLTIPGKWTIPTNTIIAPRGFLLVWADSEQGQNGQGVYSDLHADFKLENTGEQLGLFAPDGTPLHTFTFFGQIPNWSQGLYPDGNTNSIHFMPNWTPRTTNQIADPPSSTLSGITTSLGSNSFAFSASAVPGHAYRAEWSSNLSDAVWFPLSTVRATNGFINIVDSATNQAQRFYRIVLIQ